MERPFKLPGGTIIGWFAAILAGGVVLLYMPGMPASLGAAEWVMVGLWSLVGAILYIYSTAKYGKEHQHHDDQAG
ncbi:hypothetical protein [Evansella clarkii]|nr:hypothetical protein [Evansella clarkii]